MILVTDATGFVGRSLVRRLAAEGREVRAMLRPSRREQRLPTGIPFSTVSANMGDQAELRAAMQDVSAIVHLTATADLDRGRPLESYAEDTANLIEAAREVGIRRLIQLDCLGADSTCAYPDYRAMGEAEMVVRQSDLDHTILQTAITYGPGDAFTNVLVMLAKSIPYVMPIPDATQSRFQPLWIADLLDCLVAALDRSDLGGKTIPLGGPEHFTFEQLTARVLKAAQAPRRLVRVRMPFLQIAIVLSDALLPHTPTPHWWIDLLTVGSATDLVTVQRHFGFDPAPFAEKIGYLRDRRPWRRDLMRLTLRRQR